MPSPHRTFHLPARILGEPRLSHPKAAAFVHHSKNCALMSQMGHDAGRDPAVAAVHVCFAPKATPSHCNPPISAEVVAKVFLH
jgi:hypothetical protein